MKQWLNWLTSGYRHVYLRPRLTFVIRVQEGWGAPKNKPIWRRMHWRMI